MKDTETPRRIRLDLNKPAELAIYNAMQEVEKLGADVRLTKVITLLSEAKDILSDFIEGVDSEEKEPQFFLLQYHLSRRSDEGHGRIAFVKAKTEEEARLKLRDKVSYKYVDALDARMVYPDLIECLNI